MAIGPKLVDSSVGLYEPAIPIKTVYEIIERSAKHIQRDVRDIEATLDMALREDGEQGKDSDVFEVETTSNQITSNQEDLIEVLRIVTLLYKANGWGEVMVEFMLGKSYKEDLVRIYFFKHRIIDDFEDMNEEGTADDGRPAFLH